MIKNGSFITSIIKWIINGSFSITYSAAFFSMTFPGTDQVTVELTAQSSGSTWVRGLVWEVSGGWVVFGGSLWGETTGCRTLAQDGKKSSPKTSHDSNCLKKMGEIWGSILW